MTGQDTQSCELWVTKDLQFPKDMMKDMQLLQELFAVLPLNSGQDRSAILRSELANLGGVPVVWQTKRPDGVVETQMLKKFILGRVDKKLFEVPAGAKLEKTAEQAEEEKAEAEEKAGKEGKEKGE
jgi:hypothetical protein